MCETATVRASIKPESSPSGILDELPDVKVEPKSSLRELKAKFLLSRSILVVAVSLLLIGFTWFFNVGSV